MTPCSPPPLAANESIAATATAAMKSTTAAPTAMRTLGPARRADGSSASSGSGSELAGMPARYGHAVRLSAAAAVSGAPIRSKDACRG